MTIGELFPGKVGRVELTRVALRLRRPDLLKMKPTQEIDSATQSKLESALNQVRRG